MNEMERNWIENRTQVAAASVRSHEVARERI